MTVGFVITQHTSVCAHSLPPPPAAEWLHLSVKPYASQVIGSVFEPQLGWQRPHLLLVWHLPPRLTLHFLVLASQNVSVSDQQQSELVWQVPPMAVQVGAAAIGGVEGGDWVRGWTVAIEQFVQQQTQSATAPVLKRPQPNKLTSALAITALLTKRAGPTLHHATAPIRLCAALFSAFA